MKNIGHTLKGFAMGVGLFLLIALVCGVLLNVFGGIDGLFLIPDKDEDSGGGGTVMLYRHDIYLTHQDNEMEIHFSFYNSDPTNYTSLGVFNEDECVYEESPDESMLLSALPRGVVITATGIVDISGSSAGSMAHVFGVERQKGPWSEDDTILVHYTNIDSSEGYIAIFTGDDFIPVGEIYDTVTPIPLSAMPDVEWIVEEEVAVPAA